MQLLGGAVGALALPAAVGAAEAVKRPNVVFIYADDMGKGILSHFGQKHFTTPNIDRIFREGADFTFAHGCMYCAPSRASLLTGYHDAHTKPRWSVSGTKRNTEATVDAKDVLLPAGERYLPDVFRAGGYVTANIGKLGYGFLSTEKRMARFGWDTYFGYMDHGACHGFFPPFLWNKPENGPRVKIPLPGNTHADGAKSGENETYAKRIQRWTMTGKKTYAPDVMITEAEKFLDRRSADGKPFFLMYSTTLPHGPVQIPASQKKYTGFGATPDTYWPAIDPEVLRLNKRLCYWDDTTGRLVKPVPAHDSEGLTDLEMEYATMMRILDREVGRIFARLEAHGLLDSTIVMFASDNGHENYISQTLGARCLKHQRKPGYAENTHDVFKGNLKMRGLKWDNREGGVCIPFAMRWPGKIQHGTKIDDLIAMYDLVPTFADLLKVPINQRDGCSILPLLEGKHFAADRAVVTAGGKPTLILNNGWKLRGGELFNLKQDPGEHTDVAEIHPNRVKAMAARLDRLRD